MPSFDVSCEVNMQEVKNAIDISQREIATRYDFRNAKVDIELHEKESNIEVRAEDDMKIRAVDEILKQKLSKRGISLKSVTFEEPQKAGGDTLRQVISVRAGLTADELREMNKFIKTLKMKVSSQAQGEELRVTGKNRDDLQKVISAMKEQFTEIDLQFGNFRE